MLPTEQADLGDPLIRVHAALSGGAEEPSLRDGLYLGRPSRDKFGNTLAAGLGDTGYTAVIVHIYRLRKLAGRG